MAFADSSSASFFLESTLWLTFKAEGHQSREKVSYLLS